MYAVIKTGGKQYRVSPGDKLRVESLDVAEGDSINFDEILMVCNGDDVTIGSPLVSDAVVSGKVLSHGRGKKVEITKFKRRKHYKRRMGHRQNYTELEIVSVNGVSAPASSNSESKKTSTPKPASAKSDNASNNNAAAATAEAPKF